MKWNISTPPTGTLRQNKHDPCIFFIIFFFYFRGKNVTFGILSFFECFFLRHTCFLKTSELISLGLRVDKVGSVSVCSVGRLTMSLQSR